MELIIGKIAITAALFAVMGLLAIWIRVIGGGEPGNCEKVVCSLAVLIGSPTSIIATLLYIWF